MFPNQHVSSGNHDPVDVAMLTFTHIKHKPKMITALPKTSLWWAGGETEESTPDCDLSRLPWGTRDGSHLPECGLKESQKS